MGDASDTAVGTALWQYVSNHRSLIPKKLKPSKTRYSTFDRELLAIYLAIRHFHHFVEGRTFCVYTDHKPLTHTIASHSNLYIPHQICHMDFISQFSINVRHISDSDNTAANAMLLSTQRVMDNHPPLITITWQ